MKLYQVEKRNPSVNGKVSWTIVAELSDKNEAIEYAVRYEKQNDVATRCREDFGKLVPIHRYSKRWAHIS